MKSLPNVANVHPDAQERAKYPAVAADPMACCKYHCLKAIRIYIRSQRLSQHLCDALSEVPPWR